MKLRVLMLSTGAAALMCAPVAFAGPPAGVPAGPPAGVTMGPPAGIPPGPPSVPMGPPAGVPAGPPSGVTTGPPDVATGHIPDGVPLGQPDVPQGSSASSGDTIGSGVSASAKSNAQGNNDASPNNSQQDAANILGNLNAAHASAQGLSHASSNSIVGELYAYQQAMAAALGESDPTLQQNDIIAARQQLADVSNKQLTADAVMKIDDLLGVGGTDPTLGLTP